jgi:hypothetical protein
VGCCKLAIYLLCFGNDNLQIIDRVIENLKFSKDFEESKYSLLWLILIYIDMINDSPGLCMNVALVKKLWQTSLH